LIQWFSVFNGPNYLTQRAKTLDVGAGDDAKKSRCLELDLKFDFWLHNPVFDTEIISGYKKKQNNILQQW